MDAHLTTHEIEKLGEVCGGATWRRLSSMQNSYFQQEHAVQTVALLQCFKFATVQDVPPPIDCRMRRRIDFCLRSLQFKFSRSREMMKVAATEILSCVYDSADILTIT